MECDQCVLLRSGTVAQKIMLSGGGDGTRDEETSDERGGAVEEENKPGESR